MGNSMYWKKKRRQFLAAIFGLVVGASIPAYIDTHPQEYQQMLKWLRNKFGKCKDRWSHDWKVSKHGVDVEVNDSRTCRVCGCKQVCIGHHSFMDADPMAQWKETTAPVTCDHDYENAAYNLPNIVVCSKTNPYVQYKFRKCNKCFVLEIYDNGWTTADKYLVLATEDWEKLKQATVDKWKVDNGEWKGTTFPLSAKARGLSGKHRSIDDE